MSAPGMFVHYQRRLTQSLTSANRAFRYRLYLRDRRGVSMTLRALLRLWCKRFRQEWRRG